MMNFCERCGKMGSNFNIPNVGSASLCPACVREWDAIRLPKIMEFDTQTKKEFEEWLKQKSKVKDEMDGTRRCDAEGNRT